MSPIPPEDLAPVELVEVDDPGPEPPEELGDHVEQA
jgi:hypothetical protein